MNFSKSFTVLFVLVLLCFIGAQASNECVCSNNDCQCCEHVSAKVLGKKLNVDACADIDMDWNTMTFTLSLLLNGDVVESKVFHTDERAQFCVDALDGEFCVEVVDLLVDGACFSGTIDLRVKFLGIKVGTWDLGHFALGGSCQ